MARLTLLNAQAITAAGTFISTPVTGLGDVGDMTLEMIFDWGSGGTTLASYVQTSLDGGTTWIDLAAKQFATADATRFFDVSAGGDLPDDWTATDGALANGTSIDGILGDQVRVKYVVVGTYAATTLSVYAETKTGVGGGEGPRTGNETDRSGTITTGGTAQQAAPQNPNRRYLFVQNPSTSGGTLWFSVIGTAVADVPCRELPPGASYESSAAFCPTGAVSVIHPVTSAKFLVLEG